MHRLHSVPVYQLCIHVGSPWLDGGVMSGFPHILVFSPLFPPLPSFLFPFLFLLVPIPGLNLISPFCLLNYFPVYISQNVK
jgi:hypothetical protein